MIVPAVAVISGVVTDVVAVTVADSTRVAITFAADTLALAVTFCAKMFAVTLTLPVFTFANVACAAVMSPVIEVLPATDRLPPLTMLPVVVMSITSS